MTLDATERARLAELPMLEGAPPSLVDALARDCVKVALAKNETILEEGSANDSIFLILSGEVGVRLSDGGKHSGRISEVRLATLKVGEVFGEYSMFDGERTSANVFATSPTVLARFPGELLRRELAANAEAGRTVYRNMIGALVKRLRAKDAELDLMIVG